MEEKKSIKISLSTLLLFLAIIIIIILAVYIYIEKTKYNEQINSLKEDTTSMQNTINNLQGKMNKVSNIIGDDSLSDEASEDTSSTISEDDTSSSDTNFILYNGLEMSPKTGVQDLKDMKTSKENIKKYNNVQYYNYGNGKFEGITVGKFGEETYSGVSVVTNVKRIAMTQKYDAIPRKYSTIKKLPKQLEDMSDYSSVDIQSIDLDNDGKNEIIVCYTINYAEGQIGDGKPQADSGIVLFDSSYNKIADLVTLENGFFGNQKNEASKVFLSLKDVDYIDINKDGIMEIIIKIPTYEGTKISILEYKDGNLNGKSDLKASVLP